MWFKGKPALHPLIGERPEAQGVSQLCAKAGLKGCMMYGPRGGIQVGDLAQTDLWIRHT